MPRFMIGSQHQTRSRHTHTNPLIWCVAIICTFLAVLVIFIGLVVFIGYLAIKPKVPFVSVTNAHLDMFDTSQAGVLSTQLTIWIKAENDNEKAHASFSDFIYKLSFDGINIDTLKNWPFEVSKNNTVLFKFVATSTSIPLDPEQMATVDRAIKLNKIVFFLRGHTMARWRVGPLKSVRFWCNLDCTLQFQLDGPSINSHCTSKAH